jgi:hypothetical protein
MECAPLSLLGAQEPCARYGTQCTCSFEKSCNCFPIEPPGQALRLERAFAATYLAMPLAMHHFRSDGPRIRSDGLDAPRHRIGSSATTVCWELQRDIRVSRPKVSKRYFSWVARPQSDASSSVPASACGPPLPAQRFSPHHKPGAPYRAGFCARCGNLMLVILSRRLRISVFAFALCAVLKGTAETGYRVPHISISRSRRNASSFWRTAPESPYFFLRRHPDPEQREAGRTPVFAFAAVLTLSS